MNLYRVNHLAVVKNDFYLGVVSDKEINNWNSSDEYIEEHLPNLASPHVIYNQHLFDIIEVLEKNNLSVVPVLDENKQYKGVITNRKLLYTIANSAAIQSIGGVIVLQMNNNDYSLTEIANIIEITSKSGDILKIPFHVPSDHPNSVADTILGLIKEKMK